jgi:hypothetical protein
MAVLSLAYPHMRVTDETEALWLAVLADVADDLLLEAAKVVIGVSSRAPAVADIRLTALQLNTERATREAREQAYVDYWDRSPAERAEIDRARRECMEALRGIVDEPEKIFEAPRDQANGKR